jgi:Fic family protein
MAYHDYTLPPPRLDPRLARRLAEKKAQFDRAQPLDPSTLRLLHEDLRIRMTYHSNAIEGNTLDELETELVVEYGLTMGGHSLREPFWLL